MFSYLPSVLSSWQLPGLAAGALSSALQRRILFYLLKRTLGHLIKDNDLKLDQIDAASFGGKLEVRGVHLDAEAVTALLPAKNFRLDSGLMGSITVQLPWPQILTGDLVITISDLDICLLVDASGHTRPNASSLAESLSSVAEEALHEDSEGIELEESIQASMIEETDSANSVDIPTNGYIASVVEGLLARLKISVNNLQIRLRHDSPSSPELQLRIDTIQASTSVGLAANDIAQEITRTASIEGMCLYLCGNMGDNTSSSQDTTDNDSESEADYMAMSHAIPDLRSSQMGSQSFHSADSGDQSVYASAVGGEGQASKFFSPPDSKPQPLKLSENTEELIFKIIGEPTLIEFIMTRHLPAREEDEWSSNLPERSSISLALRMDLNNLVGFVTPASTCALLRFSDDCIASIRTSKEQQVTAVPQIKARPSSSILPILETSINIRGVDLVCAYDNPADLDVTHYEIFLQSLQGYWSKPVRIHPEVGHLRLRLQQIHLLLTTSALDSTATLAMGDAVLYEHLSPLLTEGNVNVTATLPLLLFDPHLLEQYSSLEKTFTKGVGSMLRPEAKVNGIIVESLDWRTSIPSSDPTSNQQGKGGPYWKAAYGDRGWKLRPKNRRTSSSSVPVQEVKTVLTAKVDGKSNMQVILSPLHLFVDLSTVDRILPLLKLLGKSTRADLAKSDQTSLTASFETLHQNPLQDITGQPKQPQLLTLGCDLIRVEIRVPSSAPQPQLRGQVAHRKRLLGLEVRAGLVLVDARNVQVRLGSDETSIPKTRVQFNPLGGPLRKPNNWPTRQEEIAICNLDQIGFFYKMVEDQRATNFAILGMLSSDDDSLEESLPPRLQLLREVQQQNINDSRSFVDCRLPSLTVQLSKTLLDGLELLADDFALWSSSVGQEPNENHSDSATDALKILGSRFFGTRHSISGLSGSSASMDIANQSNAIIPAFSLGVDEIYVSLIIPRKQKVEEKRRISLTASEVHLFVDSKHKPRSTLIDVSILSISMDDETASGQPLKIVSRTIEQSLSRGVLPMVSTQLLSTSDADGNFRESRLDVLLQGFTFTFRGDLSLLDDLFIFTRSPDGAFEHVEPNEVTRFSLRMRDNSLILAPTSCKACAVVLLGEMALRTKLTPDAYQTTIRGSLRDSLVLVAEERREDEERSSSKSRARTSQEYWSNAAFVKFTLLNEVACSLIFSSLTRPEVDVKVNKVNIEVLACADTLKIVEDLSFHLAPIVETVKSRSRSSSIDEDDDHDLLASLDQDAFRRARPVASLPDLLEDDLPRHPDFLKRDAPWTEVKEEQPLTLEDEVFLDHDSTASLSTTTPSRQGEDNIILQNEIVTIRLMDANGLAPTLNYFTKAQLGNQGTTTTFRPGLSPSLRVRVQGCDVIIRMFAGYDCQTTRTAVEEEARRVRRRLQKIKQMLDQGQTPDDSVEEATASLLDSIHIPLPQGQAAGGMEAADMMQTMDDELGDQSETASSASTWKQFIPGRSGPILSPQQQRKRSKLIRSKKSLIDVEVMGITLEYDQFSSKETLLSSRLLFQSKSLQILDNIKTSTWHTFLTEMAPEHSHLPRNAKDMIKIELVHVRPSPEAELEVRCRAKISPIRLHVDQDALDFIKKFAAFRPPNALPDPPKPTKMNPFIQHAEVYPIKLKLDYKPKRVDYNLLREGKTIELMNFFNFEGSEMTLRHVTIRGISGWTKFFDTLQDLWTPDVKSNQLADVLSGISPIRSLVNVGNGVADLILLPIEQYQRDGRLGKGLKAGAKSFVKSTMLEAARIGARLATGTQVILEQAETALAGNGNGVVISSNSPRGSGVGGVVGGGGSVSSSTRRASQRLQQRNQQEEENQMAESDEENNFAQISRYANQPDNLMQALSEAQQGFSRGLNEAAQTILAIPMEVYERRGGEGGSRPVIRAVPIAVLKGAAGASGAVGKTLQGIQRELAGPSREAEEDKYKRM